mmetsp:Transcript_48572/g.72064  ORF Transcript_48572/g.72064 Transcript_48572/m.72064 type:complete len:83 (+) Transcript_48572:45-293(+)
MSCCFVWARTVYNSIWFGFENQTHPISPRFNKALNLLHPLISSSGSLSSSSSSKVSISISDLYLALQEDSMDSMLSSSLSGS